MHAHGMKILIVEDEEILGRNLRDFFLRRLATVRIAGSGEEAIAAVQEFSPDLVVLDYALPGIDGLQAYDLLHSLHPQLAAILVTGHPSDALVALARGSGIAHVLVKPFSLADLDRAAACALDVAPVLIEGTRPGDRRHAATSPQFPLRSGDELVHADRRADDRHPRPEAG